MLLPSPTPVTFNATGIVVGLQRRLAMDGPLESAESLTLDVDKGIIGDHGASRRRQVTILAEEAWGDVLRDLRSDVSWTVRRANVLVRGLNLRNTKGRTLRIGACTILIHGETRPCDVMDRAVPGLRAALDPGWRGGIYGEVITPGTISIGDAVQFLLQE